jgi:ADP-heptose:LPS heptosyltransferase
MRILFCLFARLGDVLCGIPSYLALRNKYPEAELAWITLPQYKKLIPNCGITIVYDGPQPFGKIPEWSKQYDLVIEAQPMWRHREWELTRHHVVDLIAKWSNVSLTDRRIIVEISEQDRTIGLELPKEPFVTICSSPCYSWYDWSTEYRQTIVDMLSYRRIPVVTVGGLDGINLRRATHSHGRLSFIQTIELINRSKVYIGPDTGCSWLACAAHSTAKICLIDKGRLKIGTVGYQKYVDGDITDHTYQDSTTTILNSILNKYHAK